MNRVHVSCLQHNLAKAALESLVCGRRRVVPTWASGNGGASGSPRRIFTRAGGWGRAHHGILPAQRPLPATTFWAAVTKRPKKPCLAAHPRQELHISSSHAPASLTQMGNAAAP